MLGYYDHVFENYEGACSRFLGVQQEAVSPFFNAIYDVAPSRDAALLEPTLFRSTPPESLVNSMKNVVTKSDGRIVRLSNMEYERYVSESLKIISSAGLALDVVEPSQSEARTRESAPLITLCGVLAAHDAGLLGSGESVLVAVTGGAKAIQGTPGSPGLRLNENSDDLVQVVLNHSGW